MLTTRRPRSVSVWRIRRKSGCQHQKLQIPAKFQIPSAPKPPNCGGGVFYFFFRLLLKLGTASKLEAKFPLNFNCIPNASGQSCESIINPCKILQLKYCVHEIPKLIVHVILKLIIFRTKQKSSRKINLGAKDHLLVNML